MFEDLFGGAGIAVPISPDQSCQGGILVCHGADCTSRVRLGTGVAIGHDSPSGDPATRENGLARLHVVRYMLQTCRTSDSDLRRFGCRPSRAGRVALG